MVQLRGQCHCFDNALRSVSYSRSYMCSFNHIRRPCLHDSPSYIAGIDVYYGSKDKPNLPPGWELVTTTVGGSNANLNKGGDECYLALKRARVDILEGEPNSLSRLYSVA